jgi:hypothetical protein
MKNIAPGLSLKKYKGNKHEQGGIMVNALGNKTKDINKAVAEVEGGEYNYRYNPTNPKDNYILSEQLGIANMAKQADRFKNNDRISYNTRNNLLNKSVKLNEVLKAQKEQSQMQMQQAALGGMLKKYKNGSFLLKGSQSIVDSMVANSKQNDTTKIATAPEIKLGTTTAPKLETNPIALPTLPTTTPKTTAEAANTGMQVNTQNEATPQPVIEKNKKNNFKGALSAVAGAVSALGPIGQGVGAAMQLAPYAIDLGKAMFDKTSVQDLQTQGSAMKLPNTTYAKNGGKLNVKPLPKYILGGDPNSVIFKNIIGNLDTVGKRALNTIVFEKDKGSITGTGLSNAGNPNLLSNVSNEEARKALLKDYYPKVQGKFSTPMEQGDALDFVYNTGKDIRTYAYQEYLRKTDPDNKTGWKDNNDKWKDRNSSNNNLDKLYNNSIGKLSEQEKRDYIKQGKEYYYKNTYTDKPDEGVGKGVGYWDKTTNPSKDKKYYYDKDSKYYYEYGPDGTLSPGYGKTWKHRIENDKYDISSNNKPLVVAPPSVKTNIQTPTNVVPNSVTNNQPKLNVVPTPITNKNPSISELSGVPLQIQKSEYYDFAGTTNPPQLLDDKKREQEYDRRMGINNALSNQGLTSNVGTNAQNSLDVVEPPKQKDKLSEMLKSGLMLKGSAMAGSLFSALQPAQKETLRLPDFGRADDAMSRATAFSMNPALNEVEQARGKSQEAIRNMATTAGQYTSNMQSVNQRAGQQAAGLRVQEQQIMNQLAGQKAGYETQKASAIQQELARFDENTLMNKAATQDARVAFVENINNLGTEIMKQGNEQDIANQQDKLAVQNAKLKIIQSAFENPDVISGANLEKMLKMIQEGDYTNIPKLFGQPSDTRRTIKEADRQAKEAASKK